MKAQRTQASRAARSGFTLVEMTAVVMIAALAAALALPVLSALSSKSAARAAAGKVANLVNRRAALARSGGGPSEIVISGDSRLMVVIAEEKNTTAVTGANSVLGHNLLSSPAPANAKQTLSEEDASEVLDLGDAKIEKLYVKAAATGEDKETLSVMSNGACDEALFVLSCADRDVFVSVRGLSGRARVYDALPAYLATYFEVPRDETARGG
jgi:prepilin-type N-terminal cleavage/methylation domain-containing protein